MDLKLNDIPNTCVSTIKAVKDLNANYITIHISSGLKAIKAAKKVSGSIKLIGVTVLTSLDNKALKEIGYNKSVKNLIIHQYFDIQRLILELLYVFLKYLYHLGNHQCLPFF